jgi:hypothetical protein
MCGAVRLLSPQHLKSDLSSRQYQQVSQAALETHFNSHAGEELCVVLVCLAPRQVAVRCTLVFEWLLRDGPVFSTSSSPAAPSIVVSPNWEPVWQPCGVGRHSTQLSSVTQCPLSPQHSRANIIGTQKPPNLIHRISILGILRLVVQNGWLLTA